jgi:1-acyl-sn-glycerol-3-phosphate acyltransferase
VSDRPDFLESGKDTLSPLERMQIRFIGKSFEPGPLDTALRFCQRTIGARWIDFFTRNLRHVYGLDRLPPLEADRSFLCVSNHRSFFDLYVVSAVLVRRGLPHRLLFPVRSHFFYDTPLGFFVNGVMSFFAMYPPVFRESRRAALNLVGVDEIVWMLRRGGAWVGIHPEGTRKKDDDPYTLLPAQTGVGRVIHKSRVTVIPVFVNGLLPNDLPAQLAGNLTRKGPPILVVFGRPVDFGGLLDEPASPRTYRRIAERTLEVVAALGQEEKAIRATFPSPSRAQG